MDNSIKKPSLEVPEYISTLVPYPPGKPIEELEREYGVRNPVKLASNENPIGPSPMAQRAVRQAASNLHRYPDGSGYYLKKKLSDMFSIAPEEIVLGNGSNELIDFLIRVFVRPGDEVISSSPSFLVYTKMTQIAGGKNVVIPLAEFRHDLDGINKSVTERTRLIFLDNPNNPTGSVIDRSEFASFMAGLPEDVIVVLDEAYMEFVRTERTPDATDYFRHDRRIVALRTFSKAYGLAGLRIGYGIMDREVAGYLDRVRQPFNVNSLGQIAALAALDDKAHLEATLQTTWTGMKELARSLKRLGCRIMPSETNFMLVDVGQDASKIYEAMLHRGVIIRAMGSYGFPDHIRITVGTKQENKRFIEVLEDVLNAHSQICV